MILLDDELVNRVHSFFLAEMMRVPERSEAEWQWLAILCATRMLASAECSVRAELCRKKPSASVAAANVPRVVASENVVSIDRVEPNRA